MCRSKCFILFTLYSLCLLIEYGSILLFEALVSMNSISMIMLISLWAHWCDSPAINCMSARCFEFFSCNQQLFRLVGRQKMWLRICACFWRKQKCWKVFENHKDVLLLYYFAQVEKPTLSSTSFSYNKLFLRFIKSGLVHADVAVHHSGSAFWLMSSVFDPKILVNPAGSFSLFLYFIFFANMANILRLWEQR